MLVLSRKTGQTIQIGENVSVTVLKVKGNTIRLGISAPSDVRVARGELVELEFELTQAPDKSGLAEGSGMEQPSSEESMVREAVVAFSSTPSRSVQFSIDRNSGSDQKKSAPLSNRLAKPAIHSQNDTVSDVEEGISDRLPINRFSNANFESKVPYEVQQFRFKVDTPVNERSGS